MNEVEAFINGKDFSEEFEDFAKNFNTLEDLWNALVKGNPDPESAISFIMRLYYGKDFPLSKKTRVYLALEIIYKILPLIIDKKAFCCLSVAHNYAHGEATDKELKDTEKDAFSLLVEAYRVSNSYYGDTVVMIHDAVRKVCRSSFFDLAELFDLVEEIRRRESVRNTLSLFKSIKNPFKSKGEEK